MDWAHCCAMGSHWLGIGYCSLDLETRVRHSAQCGGALHTEIDL